MTAPDWTEFTHATAVPDASGASGRYGTGNPLEKIAYTGHLGRRRRRHPANVGLGLAYSSCCRGAIQTDAITR